MRYLYLDGMLKLIVANKFVRKQKLSGACKEKFKLQFCNLEHLGLGNLANFTIFRYLLTIFD